MQTVGNLLYNPVAGIFLACILGALAVSGKFSLAAANVLLFAAFLIGTFGTVNAGLRDYRLMGAGILGIATICVLLSYWMSPTKPIQVKGVPSFTVHDLFLGDFSTGGAKVLEGFSQNFKKGDVGIGTHFFEVGLYLNFEAKSVFMSLYVPGDEHAFDVITWWSDGYKAYLADLRKNIHIWPQTGEESQAISDNDVFTNKIYIYHENIFNDEQIHQLEILYRSKGLAPTFRGSGYLQYRRLQAIAQPDTAPKPLGPSVPIPQAAASAFANLPPVDLSPAQPGNSSKNKRE